MKKYLSFVIALSVLGLLVVSTTSQAQAQTIHRASNCSELEALSVIFIDPAATIELSDSFSCDVQFTGPGGSFQATFDGKGHNLILTGDEPLFTRLSNATVRNLSLSRATAFDAEGLSYFGSLTYFAINGSIIERVGSTISIENAGSYSGGLVGQVLSSTISDSYYEGAISGTASYIGGIAGMLGEGSTIERAYATSVSGGLYAGGIVGLMDRAGGPQIVRDSFFDNSLVSTGAEYGAIAGLVDNALVADLSLWMDNNYYNAAAVDEDVCAEATPDLTSTAGVCEAVNTDDSEPFYFIDNDSNAPMDQWNFDGVWFAQTPYPKFQISASPKINELSPANSDTGVAIDTDLVMTFDQNLGASSGFIYIKRSSDDSTAIEIDVAGGPELTGNGTDTITLNPLNNLEPGTQYYVEIQASALRGTNGFYFSGIDESTRWSFTTAAEASSSDRSTRRLTAQETKEKFQAAGHSSGELKLTITNVSVEYSNVCDLDFPDIVKRGSRGGAVTKVQQCMNSKGYDVGTADGMYGPMTYAGITAFQQDAGLRYVDGVVGPETKSALSEE